MREIRSSGSVEGVMGNHDSYSDYLWTNAFGVRMYYMCGSVIPSSAWDCCRTGYESRWCRRHIDTSRVMKKDRFSLD
jgi:hypothetical protein